jgi:hypothetical protein
MLLFGPVVLGLGVSDQPQVVDGPSPPGGIELAGRLQQDRFSLGGDLGGEVVGAVGQHLGMSRGDRSLDQGLSGGREGAAEHCPGGPHTAVGDPGTQVEPIPQPTGRGGSLNTILGPSSAAGVQVGQVLQPVAFQPIDQPPQLQDPLGPDGVGQAVALPAAVLVHGGGQLGQFVDWIGRMCVRVHGGKLSAPPENTSTCTNLCMTFLPGNIQAKS